jgi:hypothetical protein
MAAADEPARPCPSPYYRLVYTASAGNQLYQGSKSGLAKLVVGTQSSPLHCVVSVAGDAQTMLPELQRFSFPMLDEPLPAVSVEEHVKHLRLAVEWYAHGDKSLLKGL